MSSSTAPVFPPVFQYILEKFQQVRRSGDGWTALCPAHDDHKPSLSINEDKGTWLLHCHAGCTTEDVCAAAGIDVRDLFPDRATTSSAAPRVAAVYEYTDGDGKLLFQTVRYDPKNFKQRQPDGNGGWTWNLQGARRVLYRLPEVLAASDVHITEGEKDVETARVWGLTATCNPMGAGKWRGEYSEPLRGKRVTIIADADEPGRKHAQQVAASLAGKAQSVKVLELPGAKDLSEWAANGGNRDTLAELFRNAPEWKEQPLPWRQAFKSIEQMEQGDIRFLVSRILPEGVTFIGALPGVGKTWFALSLAKALTQGKPFLQTYSVPEPLNVLYLIPEAGERAFRKRLERMRINERFLCRTMTDGAMKLDDPLLLTAVRELKPVVFLDSAIRFNESDNENDATQNANGLASNLFALLQAGAKGVVGLHHSPKASAGREMTLENMLRGTGDMGAMCDNAYGLQTVDAETVTLKVECIKPRDFEPVPPFFVQGRPYIDQMGDFALLAEFSTEQTETTRLDAAIRANPGATYQDLSRKTGIAQGRIKDAAAKAGWRKGKEGWVDTTRQTKM